MRLTHKNLDEADKEKVVAFAKWLLDIGDGCTGKPDDTDPERKHSWVDIPPAYSIPNDEHGISNLIKFIYDDDTLQFPTAETLQQKAIVCPENETADMINSRVLSMLPGTTRTYKSFDEATPHGHDGGEVELLYPNGYLNTLSFAGLPSHNLELKVQGSLRRSTFLGFPPTMKDPKETVLSLKEHSISGKGLLCNDDKQVLRTVAKENRSVSP
ncbi:DNA helicase [Tanacetum coccineum]